MNLFNKPEWRNWQTRATQTRVGLALVGSIPTSGILSKGINADIISTYNYAGASNLWVHYPEQTSKTQH